MIYLSSHHLQRRGVYCDSLYSKGRIKKQGRLTTSNPTPKHLKNNKQYKKIWCSELGKGLNSAVIPHPTTGSAHLRLTNG